MRLGWPQMRFLMAYMSLFQWLQDPVLCRQSPKTQQPGDSLWPFLGWWVHVTLSKVAGDLQRSGIKRARLESPGIWFSRTMMINLLNSTFYCRFQQVQKIQIITRFFKVTFWFPKSRSLNPYKGHLWVQTRSLWRTWYASFSIGKNRRKIPNNFQGFSVSPLVPVAPRRGIPEGHSAIGFVCALPESPPQEDRENERDNLAILVPWICLMGVWGGWGKVRIWEDDMDGWVRNWWWIWLGWVGWVLGWFKFNWKCLESGNFSWM